MKKIKFFILSVIVALSGAITVTSCGDDDEVSPSTGGNTEKPSTEGNKVFTEAEQKAFLESTGREFLTHIQTSEVADVFSLIRSTKRKYGEAYNHDVVTQRFEEVLESIAPEYVGQETDQDYYGRWTYIYHYDIYKQLLKASLFTGHFKASKNGWEYVKANDLQFTFYDDANLECVLTLKASDTRTMVYVGDKNQWDWDRSTYSDYISNYYIDKTKLYIMAPSQIAVSLKQGGNELVNATVNASFNGTDSDGYADLGLTSLNVNAKIKVKAFELSVSKLSYTPASEASLTSKLKHNGDEILSASAKLNTKFSGQTSLANEPDIKTVSATGIDVSINILGKVQLSGTLSDADKMKEYLDRADDNDEREADFKSWVNKANDMMDVGMFFNNGKVRQASLQLECFRTNYSYRNRWHYEPVIKLNEGSSYSLNVFFYRADFRNLIDAAADLLESYQNEINRIKR